MRTLLLLLLLGPAFASGQPFEHGPSLVGTGFIGLPMQDPVGFARALERGNIRAIDRWMKHELMAKKRGEQLDNGSTMITVHTLTYNSIVDWLKKQPCVIDAAWDGCMAKQMSWPGHSRIGVRFIMNGIEHERCYRVQEGIAGVIRLPGWRPHVRRAREHLRFLGATEYPGFVEEQKQVCREHVR
jgi:hypothetical protein